MSLSYLQYFSNEPQKSMISAKVEVILMEGLISFCRPKFIFFSKTFFLFFTTWLDASHQKKTYSKKKKEKKSFTIFSSVILYSHLYSFLLIDKVKYISKIVPMLDLWGKPKKKLEFVPMLEFGLKYHKI